MCSSAMRGPLRRTTLPKDGLESCDRQQSPHSTLNSKHLPLVVHDIAIDVRVACLCCVMIGLASVASLDENNS